MSEKENRARELNSKLNAIKRLTHSVRHKASIPNGMFGILAALENAETCPGERAVRLGRLGMVLHRSMPSMTRAVNALEEEGLVLKTQDKVDRRVVYLSLTEKGGKTLEEGKKAHYSILNEVLDRLSGDEYESLMHVLDRLGEIIDEVSRE